MRQPPTQAAHSSVRSILPSFVRHLRAENKAPNTIATYSLAVEQLATFLEAEGLPADVADVKREHMEAFFVSLQDRGWRPASVAQRFRSLQQFWKWLAAEGEVPETPMIRMKAPMVPQEPPAILSPDDLRRLLATVTGTDFEARRDSAIIRLLLDSGLRRAELGGLRLEDIDFENDVAVVMGKGRRPRACPFGRKTSQAIDRYLRVRGRHAHADLKWLWLGKRGQLTPGGILQMLRRRGSEAGVPHVYTHLFRHSWAHQMLADGMQEGDLMKLAGWKSRQMLGRYGASAADERARAAYRQHSPGDKL